MVGRTISHYKVVERIGAGGMGVVYRAEDLRLGRQVALKFLPEALSQDRRALDRFQREARAASALNDPHICTIHDIDFDLGRQFIVMELLEGGTLHELIAEKPLPWERLADLGAQIAGALASAHGKGIVHRDIKPGNIFVTRGGQAKVLDFGLAKLTESAAAEAATVTVGEPTVAGAAVGTVAYMSPEQARGETLDARSDLFSFGVVLYAMATGRQPFSGSTPYQTVDAILHAVPAPPVRLNPECPAELERIIHKALEKDRRLRYQSASEMAADLSRLRDMKGADKADQPSIVVLPFENLSPDPENAFFAGGLTEELIAELAAVRALRVISRTTAMQYQGAKKSVPAIARELSVRYVLEGSVRRAGGSVRITAQLIDAATDAHLWAERYTGALDDVFDLQERLARSIVGSLKVTLSPDENARLAVRPIQDARAFDLYLRARQSIYTFSEAGLENALDLIDQALAITGPNATLYAAKGEAYFWLRDICIRTDDATLESAVAAAGQSLALDPDCPGGLQMRGLLAWKRGDMRRAVLDLRRAAESGGGFALGLLGFVAAEAGHIAEGRNAADRAVQVDPGNWLCRLAQGMAAIFDGDFAAGVLAFGSSQELSGEHPLRNMWLGIAKFYAGQDEDAGELFRLAAQSPDQPSPVVGALFGAALRQDRDGFARVLAETPILELARMDKEFSWCLAACHARMGDRDGALRWLEHAIRFGLLNYHFWSEVDPFLAPLRGDPRFEALMKLARERQSALCLD